jgi:hypothetical protein
MNFKWLVFVALAFAAWGAAAAETDARAEYNRRAAARDVELFGQLDRNGDGRLTRDEARGDLNLGPRFDDIDINRDGVMTPEELQRYIAQRYGVDIAASGR